MATRWCGNREEKRLKEREEERKKKRHATTVRNRENERKRRKIEQEKGKEDRGEEEGYRIGSKRWASLDNHGNVWRHVTQAFHMIRKE